MTLPSPLEVCLSPSPPATRPSWLVSPGGGLVARAMSRHGNLETGGTSGRRFR